MAAAPRPYGPSLVPGTDAEYLRTRYASVVEQHQPKIDFLAERLAGKSVKELEKIATAFWVTAEGRDDSARTDRIVELKPHVTADEAGEAIALVDKLRQEAAERFSL